MSHQPLSVEERPDMIPHPDTTFTLRLDTNEMIERERFADILTVVEQEIRRDGFAGQQAILVVGGVKRGSVEIGGGSVEGQVWRNVGEAGPGEPGSWAALRARTSDVVPALALPYGPAAREWPHQRPDTCQHPITRPSCPKILLAPRGGVHTCRGERRPVVRSPFGARPRSRAILVDVQVSSMNTSRAGSRSSWPSNQASRRVRTSGRSCSVAWAVFFLTSGRCGRGRSRSFRPRCRHRLPSAAAPASRRS